MIELIGELDTASTLLNHAIRRYIAACSAIKTYYEQATTLSGVPQAISDRVALELLSVISYEKDIRQAKSLIGQARNCSASIVSIHSLPTEVLARIFHLVVGTRPCNLTVNDNSGGNTSLPKYPDFLSHVCSHWRRLTMSLPALWSHIDIVNSHSLTPGFLSRAEACVARAAPLSLHIHIRVPSSHAWSKQYDLLDFLTSAAAQMRCLELTVPDTSEQVDKSIIQCCFENCVPGKFTELIIKNGGDDYGLFLVAYSDEDQDNVGDTSNISLQFPHARFESIMGFMTVLRLDGLYPLWTSEAYCGLEELHLIGTTIPLMSIRKSELRSILIRCPRLRVLAFNLQIAEESPEGANAVAFPPSCPSLNNLEVLNLSLLDYNYLKSFLGLLSPCSRPLQLTIDCYNKDSLFTHEDEVTKFFKDSNITRLWVRASGSRIKVDELPSLLPHLLPHLQVLALSGITNSNLHQSSPVMHQHDAMPTSFPLDTLYILEANLSLEGLCQAVERYPARKLVLWDCKLARDDVVIPDEVIRTELSRFFPVVENIPVAKPSPIADWDLLA